MLHRLKINLTGNFFKYFHFLLNFSTPYKTLKSMVYLIHLSFNNKVCMRWPIWFNICIFQCLCSFFLVITSSMTILIRALLDLTTYNRIWSPNNTQRMVPYSLIRYAVQIYAPTPTIHAFNSMRPFHYSIWGLHVT